jgi:L-arabinose isomerase
MPNLPVARVLWEVKPDLATGAAAWIQAGGAHHTVFTYSASADQLRMLAEIAGIECVVIDDDTRLEAFKQELRWNDAYWRGR